MKITEIRIKLMTPLENRKDKLRAFCSVTFDDEIVIRDLKIIDGNKGLFVAMPSRKLMARCHHCGCKNSLRARFCNDCGRPSKRHDRPCNLDGRKLYADVAHPINAETRRRLQDAIVAGYQRELEASRKKGYVPARFPDLDYEEPVLVRLPAHGADNGQLEAGN